MGGIVYPPPSGPTLTQDEAHALDDQYLSSDPTGYFRSRIYGLLADYQHRDEPHEPLTGFTETLRNVAPSLGKPTGDEIELQIAIDAVQLRHHVSEALLRLLHSLYRLRSDKQGSLWMQMTESPRQLPSLLKELHTWITSDDSLSVLGRFLHPGAHGDSPDV